jgi:hypothetical protein
MLADVFGYYLLLAPAVVFLWVWLRDTSPALVTLYTFGGLAYILIGSIGAVMLSAVLPPMIIAFGETAGAGHAAVSVVALGFINAVYNGLWNPLEMLLAGAWWLGMGPLLAKRRRALGLLTRVLGMAAWVDAAGAIVAVEIIYFVGLTVVLALIPVWAGWLGIVLLREET